MDLSTKLLNHITTTTTTKIIIIIRNIGVYTVVVVNQSIRVELKTAINAVRLKWWRWLLVVDGAEDLCFPYRNTAVIIFTVQSIYTMIMFFFFFNIRRITTDLHSGLYM